MQQADPHSAQFDAVLEEFVAAVKHHIEEEETKILPALAESVERSRLGELGAAFEERRIAILIEHGIISEGGEVGGGKEAGGGPGEEFSREGLYEQAKQAEVPGRSKMSKDELARTVRGNR